MGRLSIAVEDQWKGLADFDTETPPLPARHSLKLYHHHSSHLHTSYFLFKTSVKNYYFYKLISELKFSDRLYYDKERENWIKNRCRSLSWVLNQLRRWKCVFIKLKFACNNFYNINYWFTINRKLFLCWFSRKLIKVSCLSSVVYSWQEFSTTKK